MGPLAEIAGPRHDRVRRGVGWVTLALLITVFLAVGVVRIQRGATGPSILLVSIDTLRADHVGAYGASDAATPWLDSLAASGVTFDQAFAPVPLTLPSHASLLTGLDPPRHGVRHNGLHRLGEVETLASRLAAAGYRTGAFVGSFVLSARTGLARGFARYDDTMSRQAFSAGVFLERSAGEVTDAALSWLSGVRGPAFVWVHYYDPHLEYRAPGPFAERFPDRPYDAEIAYVDSQLGRLVEAFRQRMGGDESLVVVTADHGESFGEHGERTHGYSLHDGVLRVPLIFSGAGLPAGRRVDTLASLIDVAPTLLGLLGQPGGEALDGRDLAPTWAGASGAGVEEGIGSRSIYAETLAPRLDHGWAPLHSARTAGWRYVRAPRPELYRVEDGMDAPENRLTPAHGGDRAELERIRAEHERAIDLVLSRHVEAETREIDAATQDALHSLGYLVATQPVAQTGLDPKDGMVHLERQARALRAFDQGRHVEARRLLEQVIAASPASAGAHSTLASVLVLQGEPQRALVHARRAAQLVPASARYRALLAMMELPNGDPEAAAKGFERARQHDPDVAELQAGLMWLAARRGAWEEAAAHERRAAELGAGRWEIQQWIGTLWASVGRLDRAEAAFLRAVELAPGEVQPKADLALVWIRKGEEARAQEVLAGAVGVAETPGFRNRLAIAHAAAGDPGRAVVLFEELLRDEPGYLPARRNLASLRRALGEASAGSP